METFKLFLSGFDYFDPKLYWWLLWMQLVLFIAPGLLIYFRAAYFHILAMVGTAVLATLIFIYDDYTITKLLGLSHITWLVSLYFMIDAVKSDRWIVYRVWAGLAAVTIVISFGFDAYEVAQYFMGNHQSVLVGVPADHPLYKP